MGSHDRWLTIGGVTIVFALFVIKDGYRESLSEITNSLNQARIAYVESLRYLALSKRLMDLDAGTKNLQSDMMKLRNGIKPTDEGDNVSDSDYGITETYDYIDSQALSLSRLLEEMPWDKKDREAVETIREGVASLRKDRKTYEDAVNHHKPVDQEILELEEDLADTGIPPVVLVNSIVQDMLSQASNHIMKQAEDEQKRRERIVHRLTRAQYVLYPLGLLVALLGKLYGKSEEVEEL